MIRFALLLSTLAILSACDSQKSSSANLYFVFEKPEEARFFFNESAVVCGSESCPSSVAGLLTFTAYANRYEVHSCSSTLVTEDTLLTNRHCLPWDLMRAGAKCLDRIRIKFPKNENEASMDVDCDEVIALSPERFIVTSQDWALLRLVKRVDRQPAPWKPQGIPFEEAVTLYPIYYHQASQITASPSDLGLYGFFRRVQCRTSGKADTASSYKGPFSELFAANDCTAPIVGGNSGSGLFDSEGNLIGLVSYGLDPKFQLPMNQLGGTNLTCIPLLGPVDSQVCQAP